MSHSWPREVYKLDYANACGSLARVLMARDNVAEAETNLLQALEAIAGFPRNGVADGFGEEVLANTYTNLGGLKARARQWEASVSWFDKAIEKHRALLSRHPDKAIRRRFLLQDHWGRAEALARLDKHAEAAADWDQAIALDEGGNDRPWFRAHRAAALQKTVQKARALEDFALAIRETETILQGKQVSGMTLYDAAAVYALAASALTSIAGETETRAVEAIRLLDQAAKKGYFRDRAMLGALKSNEDFTALWGRGDYRRWLAAQEVSLTP